MEGPEVVVAAVEVDRGPAAGIDHADPARGRAAEGHADFPDRGEVARGDDLGNVVRYVAGLEPVMHEDAVRPPDVGAHGGDALPLRHGFLVVGPGRPAPLVERASDEARDLLFRHLRRQLPHLAEQGRVHRRDVAVRKDHGRRVMGVLYRVDDVAVARDFFHERRVLAEERRVAVAVDHDRLVRRAVHERCVPVRIGRTVLEVLEEEGQAHRASQSTGGGGGFPVVEVGARAQPRDVTGGIPDAHQQASRLVVAGGQHARARGVGQLEVPHADRMLSGRSRERGDHEDERQAERDDAQDGEHGTAYVGHAQRVPSLAPFAEPRCNQQQHGDDDGARRLPAMVQYRNDAQDQGDERGEHDDAPARGHARRPPERDGDGQRSAEHPVDQQHAVAPFSCEGCPLRGPPSRSSSCEGCPLALPG